MRVLANPHREPEKRYPGGAGRARRVHARLPGYARTPLRHLPGLAERLGLKSLHVKDESERFGLPAFKVLGASYAIVREIEDRCAARQLAAEWTTLDELAALAREVGLERLVTATDGNHGRGVARVARWLGLEARVVMPGSTVPARSQAIEIEGADVRVIEGVYDEAVRLAAVDAEQSGSLLVQDTAWEGYETIPARIVEGYSTMLEEIDEALGNESASIDLVVLPVGVGSLADAMARHFRAESRARCPELISVEPLGAACLLESLARGESVSVPRVQGTMMAGLDCGTLSKISWPVLKASVDVAMAIEDDHAARAMRALAEEGIVSGESGAAGVAALLACPPAEGTRALVLSTEGATDPDNYARQVSN